ncbi:unnamed protein product [Boreogadus saida]
MPPHHYAGSIRAQSDYAGQLHIPAAENLCYFIKNTLCRPGVHFHVTDGFAVPGNFSFQSGLNARVFFLFSAGATGTAAASSDTARTDLEQQEEEQGGDQEEQGGDLEEQEGDLEEQGGDQEEQGGDQEEQGGDLEEQGGEQGGDQEEQGGDLEEQDSYLTTYIKKMKKIINHLSDTRYSM